MIYILGNRYVSEMSDLEDIVDIVSTNIEDILEWLYQKVKVEYLSEYTILIKPENNEYDYETIIPDMYVYNSFATYKPILFNKEENQAEYKHVKNELFHWCNAIKTKREKEQEERIKIEEENKEKRERELYEKLKAKYGD